MKEHLTDGGWEDFTRKIKASLSRPLTPEEIHMIMQKHYIKGHIQEKALESLVYSQPNKAIDY